MTLTVHLNHIHFICKFLGRGSTTQVIQCVSFMFMLNFRQNILVNKNLFFLERRKEILKGLVGI